MIAKNLNASSLRTVAETIYLPLLAPRTRERVRDELKRWERISGNPPLDQITKQTLRGFRNGLVLEGYAPDTIVVNLGTIQTILREACDEWDLIESVPRLGRCRIARKMPAPKGATVEQVDAAFRNADEAGWPVLPGVSPGQFWRAWIALSAWTGLRLSDTIVCLKPKHLILDERCIRFVASKTRRHGREHAFPLPEWLHEWLQPMLRGRAGDDRLFPVELHNHRAFRDESKCRVPDALRHTLADLCEAGGVDPILPKNLRQFAVTQWTMADRTAGEVVHGCGLPKVMTHYLGVLRILEAAEPDVVMPPSFMDP